MYRTNDNKYEEGSVIYAAENPTLKLIIRRYVDRIYYCSVESDPSLPDLVYFERELIAPNMQQDEITMVTPQ